MDDKLLCGRKPRWPSVYRALNSRMRDLGSSQDRVTTFAFSGKKLYSHSAPQHP